MRVLLVGMALPAAGLALFGTAIVTVLFPSTAGARPPWSVRWCIAMAVGLPFFSVLYLVRRVFYAFEDGRTPFLATLVTAVGLGGRHARGRRCCCPRRSGCRRSRCP